MSRRRNRTSNVQFEVGVAQTCHFSERIRLYLQHFVLVYENSPVTSTFTVNHCAAETRAAGTAVSPHSPAHWLQEDARRLSCFLDSQMQLEPTELCNGSRVGTFTCRYLTLTFVLRSPKATRTALLKYKLCALDIALLHSRWK